MSRPSFATPDNAPWGLYDTKDCCWMGDESGPTLYDAAFDFELARVAEVVMNERFGYITRIRLCAYDSSGTKRKDDMEPKRGAYEAMARLGLTDDQLPLRPTEKPEP